MSPQGRQCERAGQSPGSVAMFVVMQLVGGVAAYGLVRLLSPGITSVAGELLDAPDPQQIKEQV